MLLLLIDSVGISFGGMDRMEVFFVLIGIGLVILMVNMLVSSVSRGLILTVIQKVRS